MSPARSGKSVYLSMKGHTVINENLRHRIPVAFRIRPGGGVKRMAFSANNRADAEHSLFVWSQNQGIDIHEIVSR